MLKQGLILSATLCFSLCAMNIMAAETFSWESQAWDKKLNTASEIKYLSNLEKNIIQHLNRARSNPSQYAENYIAPREDFYQGKYYKEPGTADNFLGIKTEEGVALVSETVTALNKIKSMNVLMSNEALYRAANGHAQEQSETGKTGHAGGNGSSPRARVEAQGQWEITMGENIAYGGEVARDVVVQLLMDDGVPDRGHRENIFNPKFKVVGVACAKHDVFRTICVMDFSGGMK